MNLWSYKSLLTAKYLIRIDIFFPFFFFFAHKILENAGNFHRKNPQFCLILCKMEESVGHICAVCFDSFGVRSDKLVDVTEAVENLIKEWVWHEYAVSNSSCPTKICKTCRLRLYSINRGKTEKLSKWMEKLGQVKGSYE